MLSLPLPYSAAIMKWQDASITQRQIQHAQETSGTGAAAPGCVMSCGIYVGEKYICQQHLRRVGFWFDNSMFSNLRTWWELVQTLSGRHHARAPLTAKGTRDKWRTCRTPAKGLAVTCTMLLHEQHRNAAFEMEHTLSIPENVSSTLAPFLGSDLIQQNHKIHLGITAIGFQLGFHIITRVQWSPKLAKSARLWRLWQDIENVQDRNRRLSLCLSAYNPLVQDWNLWSLS